MTYQEESYGDVVEDIKPLIENHWEEIALHKEKIKLNPDWEMYETLNGIGRLKIYTVRDNRKLVGYFLVIVNKHLHYVDHLFAVNDILFIDPSYRGSTTAYRLLSFVEDKLKQDGVSVLCVNMKTHSPFDRLMEGRGFSNTERLYSKYIGE